MKDHSYEVQLNQGPWVKGPPWPTLDQLRGRNGEESEGAKDQPTDEDQQEDPAADS